MSKSPAATRTTHAVLPNVLHAVVTRLRDAWQRTRTVDELSHLSDEHLKDIGVDRREIGSVVENELARLRRSDTAWRR